MKEKIIFFTKAPKPGFGKSRLKPYLSEEERYQLCRQLIEENFKIIEETKVPTVIYFDGEAEDIEFLRGIKKQQTGDGLGERMQNAIEVELKTSEKVLLTGSDLLGISAEFIQDAFRKLDEADVVIAPAADGGYGLIGMKKSHDLFSGIRYSRDDVFEKTIQKAENLKLNYAVLDTVRDIDNLEDLVAAETGAQKVRLLGQGEYNINFLCDDSYVFRINLGSQLHLGKKQIPYEYNALLEIQPSEAVPKVYNWESRGKYLPLPFLTMEYVEGRHLDYDKDLGIAAKLLSAIHRLDSKISFLIRADQPFQAMYDECTEMYSKYKHWNKKEKYVLEKIEKFLSVALSLGLDDPITGNSIINTELNNRNFIIGEKNVVIDWEKPIIGDPEQDLAHFLVPTTTNWKTDKILSADEREYFLSEYKKYHSVDPNKLGKYLVFNCLRGITWCSMAKVEYSEEEKSIANEDTRKKIDHFLSPEFLNFIEENYYEEYYGNIEKE